MAKRARLEDKTHDAWIAHLEAGGGYGDLIQLLKDNKPRRPVEDAPDQWHSFQRALYVLMMTARTLRDKDDWEWRQIRGLIRDAAVAIVEMEYK
jgi:hypothetical protein